MSAREFHRKTNVPDTVATLDRNVVAEILARHACNVSDAAAELGVPPSDLRRLIWSNPGLQDAAFEQVEARLDKAEANIFEALRCEDPRRRDAASFFVIRNSARARKRGWITSSTSVAELSISANANNQSRILTFRWRGEGDPDPTAEENEPLLDEGNLIEHDAGAEASNKG